MKRARGETFEKEIRKCPLGDVGGALLESLWRGRKGRKGGRGWMLFRTAKLNYQIKQQRRYINKIDFVRRSLSSKGKSPSFRV